MPENDSSKQTRSCARVVFDLREELSAEEIEAFEAAAAAAGRSITEHFLALALEESDQRPAA
jgi:hypothetical protein